jgi:hypothetical protein
MGVLSDPEGRVASMPGQIRAMKRLDQARREPWRAVDPHMYSGKEHAVGTAVWLQRSCFRGRQEAKCKVSYNESGLWDNYQHESQPSR